MYARAFVMCVCMCLRAMCVCVLCVHTYVCVFGLIKMNFTPFFLPFLALGNVCFVLFY